MPMKSPSKPSKAKRPSFRREANGFTCGCDEAGRGPLAGPVTAACVYVPPENRKHKIWRRINDSKQLPKEEREELFYLIQEKTFFGIASASVAEIEEINILHAAMLAMKRATEEMCARFGIYPDLVLIDGKYKPQFPYPAEPLVKGDSLSLSIAAASILAKVTRDHIMAELHIQHPHYGWDNNAGYGTPLHLAALKTHGPTPHHRRAFAPVKLLLAA